MTVDECELSLGQMIFQARQLESAFSDLHLNEAMKRALETIEIEIDHVRNVGHAFANRYFSSLYIALADNAPILIRAHRFVGNVIVYCACSESPQLDEFSKV